MIQACICSQGGAYLLEMRGHADYNPGNDVVCAGASAIAYALLGYLRNAGAHMDGGLEEQVAGGGLLLRCTGDGAVAAGYKMALIGLLQIAEKYPENVCVTGDWGEV